MAAAEKLIENPYAHDLLATAGQEALTARLLRPNLDKILAQFALLRAKVDAGFAPKVAAARAAGVNHEYGDLSIEHYPFGFCREIRDEVIALMPGDPFFQDLLGKGVTLRSVFIFLRGQFFQNAIQLGNLYFDVANDTVYPDKPKLDWAPIRELDYANVDSWSDFAEVATRYLQVEVYPNFFFPLAFPAAPFFAVRGGGRLDLLLAQYIIIGKDLNEGMRRTLALLDDEKWMSRRLPEPYVQLLQKSFGGNIFDVFPLEYAPCDVKHLRECVLPDFVALCGQKKAEALPIVKGYFELVGNASRLLHTRRLCPAAAEVGQLRSEGLVPAEGKVPAAITLE